MMVSVWPPVGLERHGVHGRLRDGGVDQLPLRRPVLDTNTFHMRIYTNRIPVVNMSCTHGATRLSCWACVRPHISLYVYIKVCIIHFISSLVDPCSEPPSPKSGGPPPATTETPYRRHTWRQGCRGSCRPSAGDCLSRRSLGLTSFCFSLTCMSDTQVCK